MPFLKPLSKDSKNMIRSFEKSLGSQLSDKIKSIKMEKLLGKKSISSTEKDKKEDKLEME